MTLILYLEDISLDLSKPIDLNIHADDNVEEIMEMLKPYLCD